MLTLPREVFVVIENRHIILGTAHIAMNHVRLLRGL
jgi:hypothetical protein